MVSTRAINKRKQKAKLPACLQPRPYKYRDPAVVAAEKAEREAKREAAEREADHKRRQAELGLYLDILGRT